MTAVDVNNIAPFKYKYTIGTLVTDLKEYQEMLLSFEQAGFTQDQAEFIFVDNTSSNQYDAYQGLNKIITAAQGEYIILCHQDIVLTHDKERVLSTCIEQITQQDSDWALLGNAGGYNKPHIQYRRITDPLTSNASQGDFPCKARSLDEDFILLKAEANLGFSKNLTGFHLYGTDICLQADLKGFNAYVINFHLTHKSSGSRSKAFYSSKKALIKKYCHAFRGRFINTTCTYFYLSSSRWLTWLIQSRYMDKRIRRWSKRFIRWFT